MKKLLFSLSLLVSTQSAISLEMPRHSLADENIESSENESLVPEPNIGLSEENRKQVAGLLNSLLADEFSLYVKTLNYHWNVESHQFFSLHAFFKDLYEKQFSICDDLAERVRALGEPSSGTMKEFSSNAKIREQSGKKLTDRQMIKQLLEDLESIIRTVRVDAQTILDKYNDLGTNNFLLNLLEKQEKTAWMLRANLTK